MAHYVYVLLYSNEYDDPRSVALYSSLDRALNRALNRAVEIIAQYDNNELSLIFNDPEYALWSDVREIVTLSITRFEVDELCNVYYVLSHYHEGSILEASKIFYSRMKAIEYLETLKGIQLDLIWSNPTGSEVICIHQLFVDL